MGHFSVSSGGFWALVVLLWVSLLSIQNDRLVCFGCPLEEYEALSKLRSSLVRHNLTSPPTWGSERDCCLWERVRCNNSTGRVSLLMLSQLWKNTDSNQYWQLDLSIFSSFHELYHLNLSDNNINSSLSCIGLKKLEVLDLSINQLQGSIPSCFGSLSSLVVLNLGDNYLNDTLGLQVPIFLGMKKLQVLNLSDNWLSGGIPISLGNLSSLRVLDLDYNELTGSLPIDVFNGLQSLQELRLQYNQLNGTLPLDIGLKKLEVLDLNGNKLKGSIPSCFGNLSSLTLLNLGNNYLNDTLGLQVPFFLGMKKLQVLDLSANWFRGGIPISLGNLSSLRVLNLDDNYLTGSLPIDVFDGLQNLQELRLQGNQLNGTLPPVIGRLASLRLLDLSHNAMEGNMASQIFTNLTSLQYLYLSSNYFNGHFSFLDLANLSKLEAVVLSNNNKLIVHLGGGTSVPSFQLKFLLLSSCILDKQTLAAPIFLSSQYKLEGLDISHNDLRGNFPNCWFDNQTRLGYLNLRNISLQGRFQLTGSPRLSMKVLDLSLNSIGGSLPSNIGTMFPGMTTLYFSSNHLIGDVPSSLGNLSGLGYLDLSDNNLSGEIPASLITNCTTLYFLKLSNNNLNGTLVNFNHVGPTYLWFVYLDGNKLTGTLPSNWSGLQTLDVQDNQLSGEISSTILSSRFLNSINLRGNRFEGQDLFFLCNQTYLQQLDLSKNKFSGRIPHCLPSSMLYINFAGNSFTGSIPGAFFGSSFGYLEALDLSNNQLSGNLPSHNIGDDMNMAFLILSGNAFEGPVPNQLCKLQSLQMLDLSRNLLSGSIPSCFGKMQQRLKIAFLVGFGVDPKFGSMIWTTDEESSVIDSTIESNVVGTEVEFVTKGNKQGYQTGHQMWITGIDLSANRLTGGIPPELGNLSWIISLNLSYNCLTGPIPITFSNLTQIESLDLSHNKLSGMIPWQLTQLTYLEVFSVAHNNLSGCLPEFKNQFATFNESSYEGNIGLHGPPLDKTCTSNSSLKVPHEEESMHNRDFDTIILYAVPVASFAVGFWVCVGVLYCNHKGRYMRMQLIDPFADSLYEKISLIVYKLKSTYQSGVKARHR